MPRLTPALLLLFSLAIFAPGFASTEDEAKEPTEEAGSETVELVERVVPPQVIIKSQAAPTYPPAALAARFEGVVVLELQVLKDGTVGEVKVIECTHPNIGFEQAATEATKKWRFEAAMKDGEAIDYATKFRMNFRVPGRGQPYVSWGSAGAPPADADRDSARTERRYQTPTTRGATK